MKVYLALERFFQRCMIFFYRWFVRIHEIKNIWKKRSLVKSVTLTAEQKQQIDTFYRENYSHRVPYWWHRLYTSYTGRFDYRYLPEYIYSTRLDLLNNKRYEVKPLEDKNLVPVLFGALTCAALTALPIPIL